MTRSRESGEDALMSTLVGRGARHGTTWFGRIGDVTKRPPLWVAVAGGLAVAGRRGRQAAARGAAGYVAGAVAPPGGEVDRGQASASGRERPHRHRAGDVLVPVRALRQRARL